MTPDIGFDTYKRYKIGTERFTSWLVGAVQSSGETLADITNVSRPSTTNSSKESKRKKASKAAANGSTSAGQSKYLIPIRDFTKLAEIVAKSTKQKVQVPSSVVGLLQDVISLRKECSRWLSHITTNGESQDQNDGHGYFISVLEQVKYILQPKEATAPKDKYDDENQEPKKKELGNIFEFLSLEEPEDMVDTSTPAVPAGQKSPGFSLPKYDIESLHDEVLISSVCFFRDLNAIRDSIRGVWSDYRAGSLGLMTASLLTSTAIEMIQRSTEDHLAMMKRWPDAPEEQNFVYWLYAHICRSDITKRERPQDDINMGTCDEAERVSWPVCSFLDGWLAGLHLHQLVFMKQGELDFSRERSCMQPREKLEEDRLFIAIMASQFHNAAKLQLEFPPAIDEITRAFRDVGKTREIPLWLVFSMQIFVDIKGVLREDIHRGLETLRTTGGRVTTAVQQHFRTSRQFKGRQEKWRRDNDSQVLKMISFVAEWVNKDIVSNAVRKHSRQRPEDIGAVVPPFLLLKYHPLLCGLMTYWLNLSIREFGISLTNAYDTILSAAHLYNAARQSKLLPVAWPDMEYLISVHSEQRLFIGGLPTSSEDFLKRYQLALGASVLNFARNRRAKKTQESPNNGGARRLRKTYPIHDIFRGRYCAMDNRANLAIEKVDAVFALEASTSLGRDHSAIAIYRNQWALTRKLSSTQLLDVLRHALQHDELHMHFDYVSMHARCAMLLTKLRSSFIASADALTHRLTASDTETQRSLQLDDVREDFTPARYIKELAMPEHYMMFIALTNSVFISDPVGAAVAEKFDSNAPIESLMLRDCDVSLERVSIAMRECIEQDGRLEVEKAKRAVKQAGLNI